MARVGSNSLGGGRKHVSNGGGNLNLNMEELICLEFYPSINPSYRCPLEALILFEKGLHQ